MVLNSAFYTILFLFTFLKIKNLKSFREHLSFVRQCDQIQHTWWFSPAKQGSSCIQGNQSSLLGPEDKTRGAPLSVLGGSNLPSFPVSWHVLVPVMPPDSSGNTCVPSISVICCLTAYLINAPIEMMVTIKRQLFQICAGVCCPASMHGKNSRNSSFLLCCTLRSVYDLHLAAAFLESLGQKPRPCFQHS